MLADKLKNKDIILASKSPRRQELLKGLNVPFKVVTKDVDESYPATIITKKIAEYLANKKADAFKNTVNDNTILITADTVVILDDDVLGKPKDEQEAIEMLKRLSGRTHEVITGVCVKTKVKTTVFSSTTTVTFKTLTEVEIDYYVKSYSPFDKAGSYGIQEWIGYIGISKIKGSYFNVMGLPVFELNEVLSNL